ncbi:hypothetical protein [Ktedonospora formicarum]|uniref:Uncharacterized protein n=1 Tax=Ktedonospora formicarum TaxID=2778364 RepID=A0A8J3IA95_9CHLR|nr:hypothetical protein [Ktedonospora formicarum]GHO48364.1 hypothetical protein KSX_65270 [Ktedonospora formicarum]
MGKFLFIGSTMMLQLSLLAGFLFAGPAQVSAMIAPHAPAAPAGERYCPLFLSDLANRLNVSVETFEQYKLAAVKDILLLQLKEGVLTQAQVDTFTANATIAAVQARCEW